MLDFGHRGFTLGELGLVPFGGNCSLPRDPESYNCLSTRHINFVVDDY